MLPASILVTLLLLQVTQGQQADVQCKCGGEYANGRKVTGCAEEKCTAKAASSSQCVTIYRGQNAIGYDCVPWASQVAPCATFDDGSRVCANATCKPNVLGGQEGDCAGQDAESWHAIVGVQINKAALDFALTAVPGQVQKIVSNLSIPDQSFSSGMDFNIRDITIKNLVVPDITYEFVPPSSLKIHVKGGDVTVGAKFSAKKFLLNVNGEIDVWPEDHKGITLDLTTTIKVDPNGKLELTSSDCNFRGQIDMKLSGAVGAVVGMLTGFVQNLAQGVIYSQVCKAIDTQVKTTLKQKLEALPTEIKINQDFGAKYKIQSVLITDSSINVQVAANALMSANVTKPVGIKRSLPRDRTSLDDVEGEDVFHVRLGENVTVIQNGTQKYEWEGAY